MAATQSRVYTEEELRPILGMQLTAAQVALLEGVSKRTVNQWIEDGRFKEYSIHPSDANRVPVWAYLEFRKERTIRS